MSFFKNNGLHFKCMTLPPGKKGVIKPDENGYYTMPIGGLNIFNSAGAFYTYEEAKHLFEESSVFQRKIKKTSLYGEWGHPLQQPGESNSEYFCRIYNIDENKQCVHFSDIWLDTEIRKPEVVIMAKLKPFGPYGKFLQESLDNPLMDTMFSIRSITNDKMVGGKKIKILEEIITFDYVSEPGIYLATKYNSPALENFNKINELVDFKLDKKIIQNAIHLEKQLNRGIESSSKIESFNNLINKMPDKLYMGW